jgi:hypothetical protein
MAGSRAEAAHWPVVWFPQEARSAASNVGLPFKAGIEWARIRRAAAFELGDSRPNRTSLRDEPLLARGTGLERPAYIQPSLREGNAADSFPELIQLHRSAQDDRDFCYRRRRKKRIVFDGLNE